MAETIGLIGDELHDMKTLSQKNQRLKPLGQCDSPVSVGPTDHREIHIRDRSQLETPRRAALSQVLINQVHTCFDRQERNITRFDRDNHWIINQRQDKATSFSTKSAVDDPIEGIYLNQYKKAFKRQSFMLLYNFQNFAIKKHKTARSKINSKSHP